MKAWTHTIVKNEERYIWYSLSSVVEYVDKMLVWDSGSTDRTVEIIKQFQQRYPDKVDFKQFEASSRDEITALRQKMIEETKADWIIILDGDEVWWRDSISQVIQRIKQQNDLESIVVPFVNLIGDIYHYQPLSAGKYKIDDRVGHLTVKAINMKIPGLHVDNPYPLEGFFDKDQKLVQDRSKAKRVFIDAPFLHFSHLVRSSSISTDSKTTARKGKRKFELGNSFPLDYYYPESFFSLRPENIPDPWQRADLGYLLTAKILTPLKEFKRRLNG